MPQPNATMLLDIATIREGIVLLKNGSMRALLDVSSVNFALKSAQEQEAIIFAYQDFLNSLDFPVQIFVNSRFVNIDGYLENLQKLQQQQENDLLKIQMQEYIGFVQNFTQTANIVSTDFFVVVPFHPVEARIQQGGAEDRLRSLTAAATGSSAITTERFLHYKAQLAQRIDFVASGLHRIGVAAHMLSTEELITLYWSLYNAGDLKKRRLAADMFGAE
ncbi:MAG: hypothetical protein WD850_01720 [Candidatus Spechtbacterales bacterium]